MVRQLNHEQEAHNHLHGVADRSIISSERGIWAVKWSFLGLLTCHNAVALVSKWFKSET